MVGHLIFHDFFRIGDSKFGADALQTFGFDIIRMERRIMQNDRRVAQSFYYLLPLIHTLNNLHDRGTMDTFGVGHQRRERLLRSFLFLLEDVVRSLCIATLLIEVIEER